MKPSPEFQRVENNVHSELKISLSESVLGCVKEVSTLLGSVSVEIPQLTKHEEQIVIEGKGFVNEEEGTKGNHILNIKVEWPTNLTEEQ